MADYSKRYLFLKEIFPNQFNTIPRIIVWTIVFIIDVVIIFAAAHLIGIPFPIGGHAWSKIGLILYLAAAFALFFLESYIYNKIRK